MYTMYTNDVYEQKVRVGDDDDSLVCYQPGRVKGRVSSCMKYSTVMNPALTESFPSVSRRVFLPSDAAVYNRIDMRVTLFRMYRIGESDVYK